MNVGFPGEVTWQEKLVTTGIFKEPIHERVMVRRLNLDGDQQADLSVHGGVSQAVYAYPLEHYDYWRTELPGMAKGLRRAIQVEALPESWKGYFQHQLEKQTEQ